MATQTFVGRPLARDPWVPPPLPIQHTPANEPPPEPTLRTEDSPVIDRTTKVDPPPVPHFERTYDISSYPPAPDPGEAIPSPPQTRVQHQWGAPP